MVKLTDRQKSIIDELERIGAFMFGQFALKNGLLSPVYVDMRVIISYPSLMRKISEEIYHKIQDDQLSVDCVCGVPYAALPVATCVSIDHDIPMVIIRKETKTYGTGKRIEGKIAKNEKCLVIEDTVTTGASIMDITKVLRDHDLIVEDIVVILDRNQGACETLKSHNLKLRSLFSLTDVLDYLLEREKIDQISFDKVKNFLLANDHETKNSVNGSNRALKVTLENRLAALNHPQSKSLAAVMQRKKSNLCLSADLADAQEILDLVAKIGSEICLLKLHNDIINNATCKFYKQLKKYAEMLDFKILEDRKFSDIGNTVRLQMIEGSSRISTWTDFITVHAVAGAGTFEGLREGRLSTNNGEKERNGDSTLAVSDKPSIDQLWFNERTTLQERTRKTSVCKNNNIGCLVVSEMSSKDALCNDSAYQSKCYDLAQKFDDIVAGFICQKKCANVGDLFLYLTPGVNIEAKCDSMSQRWRDPVDAIKSDGNDIVIVGRGIYATDDPRVAARKFKEASWAALNNK
uniref:Uridine 5'-monophosphate synthase n=1 Tax=Romanomermis culicivorax TaxID=13658 RepID=A0A915HI48_ROMCU